jgi:hypothetical protein
MSSGCGDSGSAMTAKEAVLAATTKKATGMKAALEATTVMVAEEATMVKAAEVATATKVIEEAVAKTTTPEAMTGNAATEAMAVAGPDGSSGGGTIAVRADTKGAPATMPDPKAMGKRPIAMTGLGDSPLPPQPPPRKRFHGT